MNVVGVLPSPSRSEAKPKVCMKVVTRAQAKEDTKDQDDEEKDQQTKLEEMASVSVRTGRKSWKAKQEKAKAKHEQKQATLAAELSQQANEDADMESTYGDDGDGSSSFCETNSEESLETKFTTYNKETSSDEGELVRVKLPSSVYQDMIVCNVNEDQSVIETESDETKLSKNACSYEDGEVLDDMLLDEMVWDEFISSLSRDVETRHMQEEQVDEIAAYGVDGEDVVIEDAASVELSKNMADGPWDLEQVIFVEPKEEHAMDTGGLAKERRWSLMHTYEGIVQLAKMKSRKVKQKLELGMLKPSDYVPIAIAERSVVQQGVAPCVQRVDPVEVMPMVCFVPMEVLVCEVPMPRVVELVKEDELVVKRKQCAEVVVGAKHQVQHEEKREPIFLELLSEKLANCSRVANPKGWEIDKESEQNQDGGQVLVEQQANEDADMESTYGDDGDGSLSFCGTSNKESLETKFTTYSKETTSNEGELVRVKLPSSVYEDMIVHNVNEDQVKPRKEDMQIKVRKSSKKEKATLDMEKQQLDEAVVAKLPCDADEVDPFWSVIETESDETRLSGYACSYKDGEALDDMLLDEMVWDEFISSLSRDAKTWHMQEEQVDEIAAYGVDGEDVVIEDAASVELSKNMVDGPWNLEQVIFVEPEEEQAMDVGGLAKEVCALLLMEMLLDVAMQLAFRRLQE
ncbi:hypothetical protein L7F22_017432 [Adiantum nelumboides]|nr:hypothetical protein [Adiantum nelumboides]